MIKSSILNLIPEKSGGVAPSYILDEAIEALGPTQEEKYNLKKKEFTRALQNHTGLKNISWMIKPDLSGTYLSLKESDFSENSYVELVLYAHRDEEFAIGHRLQEGLKRYSRDYSVDQTSGDFVRVKVKIFRPLILDFNHYMTSGDRDAVSLEIFTGLGD